MGSDFQAVNFNFDSRIIPCIPFVHKEQKENWKLKDISWQFKYYQIETSLSTDKM